jgi:hypothetical protein
MLTVGQAHKGLSFITAPIREPWSCINGNYVRQPNLKFHTTDRQLVIPRVAMAESLITMYNDSYFMMTLRRIATKLSIKQFHTILDRMP